MGLTLDLAKVLLGMNVKRFTPLPDLPLGRVMLAVGQEGLPDDVRVINVSALAREANLEEVKVEETLVKEGHVLCTSRHFRELVAWLTQAILEGSARLPYHPQAIVSTEGHQNRRPDKFY